ncbi:growth/differentiation factor 8 [Exaiptasia diaphana]|uniref:TGF-beta family profile domain-containing protein n=1 Tax=Exaiptasia diaphana TaxID=2652724 RepID=A0A913XL60_EXADI|nr:growth/differentiation factor 8 [Exaiptasia diaphana]KXJ11069.1 Growth/differentiation factor 11 [Exaiptasia diaphana]
MLPGMVLVLLATAQGLAPPLQKTATVIPQDANITVDSYPQNRSIPERSPDKVIPNSDNRRAGCSNCGRNTLPSKAAMEYRIRLDVIKQQILQGLQMSEPPKIKRRDFNVPPPLLKKFQEAKDRQRQIDEQPPEIKTEVVLLGSKVSQPRRSKLFAIARKLKFEFHVSYKVYITKVHSATLWLYLPKSRRRQSKTTVTIKEANNDVENLVKEINEKDGEWVSIEIQKIVKSWKRRALSEDIREMNQNKTLEITCSNCENLNEEAIGSNSTARPFIVIDVVSVMARKKRSINCRPGIRSCCLQELYVSFADMGWDNWILIPEGLNVNYCTGSCFGHILPVYSHSGLLQKVALQKGRKDMAPCCSPTKLAPLSILYFDPYENIFQQDIENMTALRCGCS